MAQSPIIELHSFFEGLNRLAISDANKHMIEDSGGIHIYQEFLEKGWGDERAEACRGLWTLCFNELVSEYVLGNAQLMSSELFNFVFSPGLIPGLIQ